MREERNRPKKITKEGRKYKNGTEEEQKKIGQRKKLRMKDCD
jgi:hypothetical protein